MEPTNPEEDPILAKLSPEERQQYEQSQLERAEHYVEKLDPTLLEGLDHQFIMMYRAYADAKRNLHTGVDMYGERLGEDARRIMNKTLQSLERKLAEHYTHGDGSQLQNLLFRLNLGRPKMVEAIDRRLSRTQNPAKPQTDEPQNLDTPANFTPLPPPDSSAQK